MPPPDCVAGQVSQFVDINLHTHEFATPTKQVKTVADIKRWENSPAYADIIGCITMLSKAVEDRKLSDAFECSEIVCRLVEVIQQMSSWVDAIPPIEQPQRFGNVAYKDFHLRLVDKSATLLQGVLDATLHNAVPELQIYLHDSFGNATRIDYGTGHELAFIAFLCCLFKIGALKLDRDAPAVVLKVFNLYIEFCRKLQLTYRMEPAGSQGVWSLDDFQFIAFIFGSSQLVHHARITPSKFPEPDYYNGFAKDYLFLSCIKYICSVKTGPFAEHSNQLWNISGVPNWGKVNTGLIKMYKAEVLSKFPVIQHFYFGSLLTLDNV